MNVSSVHTVRQNFLSEQQNETYGKLDKHLREKIFYTFLQMHLSEDVDRARFLLDVVGQNPDLYMTTTNFFFRVLNARSLSPLISLQKMSEDEDRSLRDFFQFFLSRNLEPDVAIAEFCAAEPPREIKAKGIASQDIHFEDLLRCQHSFIKMQSLVLSYISSRRNSWFLLPKESYENVCKYVHEASTIDVNEKKASLKLILKVTIDRRRKIGGPIYSESDARDLLQSLILLHELYGKEGFISFCEIVMQNPDSVFLDAAISVLHGLNNYPFEPQFADILTDFILKPSKCDPSGSWKILAAAVKKKVLTEHPAVSESSQSMRDLFRRFQKMPFPIDFVKLSKMREQYEKIQRICVEKSNLQMIGQIIDLVQRIRDRAEHSEDDALRLIALARLAIYIKFDIYLHSTQVLTVLGQLLFSNGCIAQVKTGEGKSMIIALMTFVLVMQNKSVHIISSSENLAIRDQEKYSIFFNEFKVITDHICEQEPASHRFQATVLYGTAACFEFAVMREMLYRKPLFPQLALRVNNPFDILPKKRFDVVIVDEVDNMTIDTGQNGARLSLTAEITYDWVYTPIFTFVRNHCSEEVPIQPHMTLQLRNYLSTIMGQRFSRAAQELPEKKLSEWLSSAYEALFKFQENNHYIVSKGKILIVDAQNTGRIMLNSRWSKAIHEFIEVKHSLKTMKESLNPISLSPPVYYPMYKMIFGLTGTMGSREEREEIQDIYNLESFDVPTYYPPLRIDYPPICLATDEELLQRIAARALECQEKGRPILILVQTIAESHVVSAMLERLRIPGEVLNEVQEKPEEYIIRVAGCPDAVTTATNTAARGTDIQLTAESRRNGGLHVLLAFFSLRGQANYPISRRVQEQAEGRAGRHGDPGSSEMLVVSPNGETIEELQQKSSQTISYMKSIHKHQAKVDRFQFSIACEFYQRLSDFHKNIPKHLPALTRNLAQMRLLDLPKSDFKALSEKDVVIVRKSLDLLTGDVPEHLSIPLWSEVLEHTIDRIHHLVINDWSVNFYQTLNDSLDELRSVEILMGMIGENISSKTGVELEQMLQKTRRSMEEEITAKFTSRMDLWSPYLSLDGEGALMYLRELRSDSRPHLIQSLMS